MRLTSPSPFTANTYQIADSCLKEESWQTQFRGLASYTIPKIDVLVSTIFRSQPNAAVWLRCDAGREQHGVVRKSTRP